MSSGNGAVCGFLLEVPLAKNVVSLRLFVGNALGSSRFLDQPKEVRNFGVVAILFVSPSLN